MSLTKSQEIEILKNAAAALGADSYAGPWLESVIPFIEMDLKSDRFPDYDLRAAQGEYLAKIAQATQEAKVILDKAHSDAAVIRENAAKTAGYLKQVAVSQLKEAIRKIEA